MPAKPHGIPERLNAAVQLGNSGPTLGTWREILVPPPEPLGPHRHPKERMEEIYAELTCGRGARTTFRFKAALAFLH